MRILPDFLKNIFNRRHSLLNENSSAPRDSFRNHYRSFRSLLTANNNALELMAEMEQALEAGRPFSMAFVRGHCTALTVNVYKMIRQLQGLSGGKYRGLTVGFKAISGHLENILAREPAFPEGKFILTLAEIDKDSADHVGEKMANLGEVRNRVGLKVPDGFVITATAARHFMRASNLKDEINRRLKILDHENLEELYTTSAAIQQLISNASLPADLEREIIKHYRDLADRSGHVPLVSMRSSALGEDSGNVSFAGQYRTQLNVSEDLLGQTYKEIVASKYRSQAIVYRLQRGFRHQDVTMCVGCLAMVEAEVSGVIYSRSPKDPSSGWAVISAVAGPAGQVVDGTTDTDIFRVRRDAPNKILAREFRRGETSAVLTDAQAIELTRMAVRLEGHFGSPQDIEWSIDKSGTIVILQSRPLGEHTILEYAESEIAAQDQDTEQTVLLAGGVAASRGVATGPVCIVNSNVDLLRFPKGAVLVIAQPRPELATLLGRAVAVVSETGQIAAHLATVAREFGIPAIFGMKGAIQRLVNDRVVTVDATGRRVYEGRAERILAHASPLPNLMAGSPVYRLLKEALTLITPLNLIDPASPYFRPSSCKTLHDLTRFCHEKGVTEMFSFGSRHGLDEKAAKQLAGESPFKWWVIDLADGFREGFDHRRKSISIDEITSLPMVAIWQGMTAVPWQGPPPVSLRGFGSILFQSTMNPNLEPAVRSSFTAKNFFLVSRNFCNLSVRLGYHFSLVEAHLSDLLTENYVSFQFKGGAADEGRRFLRVHLLKEILEQFDFRAEQKADSLAARIEKRPVPFLVERLKVLGYLLIHTRQIDMVMGKDEMMVKYRQKILSDLDSILAGARKTETEI